MAALVTQTPLIDPYALARTLNGIVENHDGRGDSSEVRSEALTALKQAYQSGCERAEALLQDDGSGTACARRLSNLQDQLMHCILDFALCHVFPSSNPSMAEKLSVVAVGGYGRGTLAPGSDIDLLFVLPYKQTPWGESVVEYVLYLLWDMGFKVGHATRNIDECVRLSKTDMTIRTSILEARYVCGNQALFAELTERFKKDVVRGTAREFIVAKLEERDDRHKRSGASRYRVEPNIKEGKGGLRDLHTLFWIARYFYGIDRTDELIKLGVLTRKEHNLFVKCEDFLWAVRCHLHFLTGRPEERLSFDVQTEMARRLDYHEHGGLAAVERFMKHYFLIAKDVGDLTRIFCAQLEESNAKDAPGLNRLFLNLTGRRRRKIRGSKDFVLETKRITAADETVFQRDPVNLIRMFWLADKHNVAFHPDTIQLVRRSLKFITKKVRENPEANRLFLDILTSRNQPETVLRRMNETGVLGRFIPDFGRVVAMMQFNMYHHFTVDEHLLRSIGILSEIDRGELEAEHPLANKIFSEIKDRVVLYVALFLHDIAKGRNEDHSIAGAKVARKLCPRFGLTAAQTELVAWLIEEHLTMSAIAQSRDLADRKTIQDFAGCMQTFERMKMLVILTVCDIKAVGPGVWNGWKGQLLRTLYYETEPLLTGGFTQVGQSERVHRAMERLGSTLREEKRGDEKVWNQRQVNAYQKLHYPAYWLRVDPETMIYHARFINDVETSKRSFATGVHTKSFEGITEITVYAPDHPRLLAYVTGACAVAGANIVDAQIFTTTNGKALDSIFINREFNDDADELRRGARIGELIEDVLNGSLHLPAVLASKSQKTRRQKAFSLEPTVTIDNTVSNLFSVVEVSGLDRLGLLYDLTTAMADLNLNIASAHIATFGERALDGFYVTDLIGEKITNPGKHRTIKNRLLRVFMTKPGTAGHVPTKAKRNTPPATHERPSA
uniref:[protein-PII] uridylyltransferase n=1 Tax=Pararhizobium sp. IMCC3301 TaxID=3067904 RepID=UPI00274116A0|nr:[protein-PII] uridylyltransferase [Pararhizobium sp. IMCC3301]